MSYFTPYHNTTETSGKQYQIFESKAATQDARVEAYFRQYSALTFTPSEVQRAVLFDAPLTSARRAISNLTAAGILVKTDTQRAGPYGRPEHAWKLA